MKIKHFLNFQNSINELWTFENALAYLKSIFYKIEFQKNLQCTNCITIGGSPSHTGALDRPSKATKSLLSQCFDMPQSDSKLVPTPYDELEEYKVLMFCHVGYSTN